MYLISGVLIMSPRRYILIAKLLIASALAGLSFGLAMLHYFNSEYDKMAVCLGLMLGWIMLAIDADMELTDD